MFSLMPLGLLVVGPLAGDLFLFFDIMVDGMFLNESSARRKTTRGGKPGALGRQ